MKICSIEINIVDGGNRDKVLALIWLMLSSMNELGNEYAFAGNIYVICNIISLGCGWPFTGKIFKRYKRHE